MFNSQFQIYLSALVELICSVVTGYLGVRLLTE